MRNCRTRMRMMLTDEPIRESVRLGRLCIMSMNDKRLERADRSMDRQGSAGSVLGMD
jgi:hypothetical protein